MIANRERKEDESIDDIIKYMVPLNDAANDNDTKEIEKAINSNVIYLDDYRKKGQNVQYESTIGTYLNSRQNIIDDFTQSGFFKKWVDVVPANSMGSVLGFTYLGQRKMALKEGLIGMKDEVDLHEMTHTDWEYETRVRTTWKMTIEIPKYIK